MRGLRDLRIVDFSSQIAGPYCTKLFADAGAEVVKAETPEGDPLRRWSATGAELGGSDSALFRFLNAGKRSVIGEPGDAEIDALVASADLVVEDGRVSDAGLAGWRSARPRLTVLSITPFGRSGPWRDRAATEFIVQAECGSIGSRGVRGEEPFQAGGRITEWIGGTFAAAAALGAVRGAQRSGRGRRVDFSLLEIMSYAASNFAELMFRLLGVDPSLAPAQSVETPSIEPTADGYVGFCTNSAQQFSDFLLLIERPDLREDQALFQVAGRLMRFGEWNAIVRDYTRKHTTADLVERASLLRIPVAPVNDGMTVQRHEQLVARGVFQPSADGDFVQPRPPYQLDFELPPPARPAPALGADRGRIAPREPAPATGDLEPGRLPLAGLRVIDLTAWWAGPSATHMLATLGADVIHIEAIQRPDGMRMTGGMVMGREKRWWEFGGFFLTANTNKRGLTLNLADPRGVEIVKRLIATADAVVENFTPRVTEGFDLGWEAIQQVNPRCCFVRMPAFGLSGPWRDHTGFAQTMEQMSGLAWVTGHPGDQPRIQRGPCDPLAGMHAAFSLLVALAERDRSGRGHHVECTMIEGALNAAAEQLIEWSAYGRLMQRQGNRAPEAAPQGLYATEGSEPGAEKWLALSVATDAQWCSLVEWLGSPAWAKDPALATLAGRRAAHYAIDAALRPRFSGLELHAAIEALALAGVPAGEVRDPRGMSRHPQLRARRYYEEMEHPVAGVHPVATVPFRFDDVERWIHRPAPTLGQHNHEILRELGWDDRAIAELEAAKIIGDTPEGL
jgi:crotonobetainyl-CoA:carnitine CoA-transferase CaiB-like acyl-CoA transferase